LACPLNQIQILIFRIGIRVALKGARPRSQMITFSESQTAEMHAEKLLPVFPRPIFRSYLPVQLGRLMKITGFVDLVKAR
jgi:hypothetical protein